MHSSMTVKNVNLRGPAVCAAMHGGATFLRLQKEHQSLLHWDLVLNQAVSGFVAQRFPLKPRPLGSHYERSIRRLAKTATSSGQGW